MYDLFNKPARATPLGAVADGADGRTASPEGGSAASAPGLASMDAAKHSGNGPPADGSPPTASEVTSSGVQAPEGTSSRYTVGFYNETSDSTGHEHHVRQGQVDVTAIGADAAIAGAIVEFQDDEDVATWRNSASSIECVETGGKA